MTKQILLCLSFIVVPLIPANAQWRSGDQLPQISVSGTAEIKVAPDEVDLSVAVESRDVSLQKAKQKNDDNVASALKFLKKEGVPDKHVQTDYITIEPVFDDRGNANVDARINPMYYIVRKKIGIKLTDVTTFDKILAGLIADGINNVEGVEFRTTELRKYKDQVRANAIKAAKEKAEAMAGELGVKVGKPYQINVNDWTGYYNYQPGGRFGGFNRAAMMQNSSQNAGGGEEANGATLAVGQISVSATVNVFFLIQ